MYYKAGTPPESWHVGVAVQRSTTKKKSGRLSHYPMASREYLPWQISSELSRWDLAKINALSNTVEYRVRRQALESYSLRFPCWIGHETVT